MPIFRYDSNAYDNSGTPEWKAMSNIYRWNGSVWQKIKKIYRFNDTIAAKWQLIFEGTDAPQPKPTYARTYVGSTTYGILNSETDFYSGDTIRTTRGDWTQSPTSIRVRVQSSNNPAGGYSTAGTADKTYNSSSSPTLSNTTTNTYQEYTITKEDALYPSYYFRGLVQATNADGTTPLETAAIRARLGFVISSFSVSSPTTYGATFNWSITGIPNNSTYVAEQVVTIRRQSDGQVVKTVSVSPGTSSLVVNDSINLTANTNYYAKLEITAYDSYYFETNPTIETDDFLLFTTALASLTNTSIPVISGTLTEGQTISVSNGSWSVTPDSYTYQWLYYDGNPLLGYEGYVAISGATSSSYTIPNNYIDVYGSSIRARVTAIKSGYTTTSAYSTPQTVSYDATLPDPPTNLSVSDVGTNRPYGNAAYSLSWSAPSNTGGVSLSGYKIQFKVPSVSSSWFDWSSNAVDTTSTSITLSGFGSNLSTHFRIYAVNSVGPSATAVETSSPVLGTTVPQAPTIGTPSSFNTYINVAYTTGATGGKPISTYTATSSPGSLTGSASSGGIIITGVTHNTAYTFTVTATNANGTSLPSTTSSTAYGVNIGSVTGITSSSTSTTITLNFTKATNSTSTRGYYQGSLDGTTTGTSYLFSVGSPNTTVTLGLAGTAVVNGVTYEGPRTSNSYSTSAAVPVNTVSPTLAPTSLAVGTTLTAGVGSWINSPTSYDIRIYRGTAGVLMSETLVASGTGITLNYTITQSDYDSGQRYFRTYVNASNAGGSSGFVAGQERGPIAAPTTYTVTWNANGGSVSPTSSSGTSGTVIYAPTPTRSGYTFLYWRDTPSGDYLYSLNAGASWTIFDTRTFYARWQASGGSAPATPTGLVNVYNGGTSYTFSWDPSSGATSYQIIPYHATDSSGSGSTAKASRNFTSGSTYDSSVDGGTGSTYVSFAVRATNANGSSAYSAIYTPYR